MDVLKNTVNGFMQKYCQRMYAEILSMDVCKNTVNGCIQVLETTSETDPLLIAHRVDDIADVDDWGKELDSLIISSDLLSDICMDQFHPSQTGTKEKRSLNYGVNNLFVFVSSPDIRK